MPGNSLPARVPTAGRAQQKCGGSDRGLPRGARPDPRRGGPQGGPHPQRAPAEPRALGRCPPPRSIAAVRPLARGPQSQLREGSVPCTPVLRPGTPAAAGALTTCAQRSAAHMGGVFCENVGTGGPSPADPGLGQALDPADERWRTEPEAEPEPSPSPTPDFGVRPLLATGAAGGSGRGREALVCHQPWLSLARL